MKYFHQAFLYVVELVIAVTLLFCIGNIVAQNQIFSWIDNIVSYDFLEKALLLYSIYQIAIFVFLSIYDSARKDATLNKIKIIKLGIVRSEFNRPFEELHVFHNEYTNNNSILIDRSDKSDVEEIYSMYQRFIEGVIDKGQYDFYLKNKLILLEDKYEYFDLSWRLSLILRKYK
ncbi:hypothetical protein [Sporosarcina sp. Marseille-Q4943]|uniref:hypothetical protein n=1 Tax=Sporosarcina sp. Marseille-Q4943 TaxID=2942204 RepID=UPI00208DB156|nr:hypothetical protein [Sporosarcina sp. Marseille-Q4943]